MFRDIILRQDEKFQNVSPVFKSTLLPVTCRGFKLFIQNPRAFLDKRKKRAYQRSESDDRDAGGSITWSGR